MRRIEDDCVDCGMHCIGDSCSKRHVEHIYCDNCGEEICSDNIHTEDGYDYCDECYEEQYGGGYDLS